VYSSDTKFKYQIPKHFPFKRHTEPPIKDTIINNLSAGIITDFPYKKLYFLDFLKTIKSPT
jgi:hypothetical protein